MHILKFCYSMIFYSVLLGGIKSDCYTYIIYVCVETKLTGYCISFSHQYIRLFKILTKLKASTGNEIIKRLEDFLLCIKEQKYKNCYKCYTLYLLRKICPFVSILALCVQIYLD